LVIIPGTHSKHILLNQSKIVAIKTYMTGELFALLSQKSVLKNSVAMSSADSDLTSFKKGVRDAMDENLLHTIFKVRTNQLFNIYSKENNYNYLSGLLIGAEIKDLKTTTADVIDINCDNADMYKYYSLAIAEAGIATRVNTFNPQFMDTSAVKGQLMLARQLNFIT
jgi:2-dehydro-3-deoxygalactonokinase